MGKVWNKINRVRHLEFDHDLASNTFGAGQCTSKSLLISIMRTLTSLQEDGLATLSTPLNIELFNFPHRVQTFMHPSWKVQVPALSPGVDTNLLTSVILLQMLTNSGLFQSSTASCGLSPSPLQLQMFPSHFQWHWCADPLKSLSLHHFCPHLNSHVSWPMPKPILVCVMHQCMKPHSNFKVIGISISTGDIICLKKGSVIWWNGPDAKWKQSNTSTSSGSEHGWSGFPKADSEPPKKKIAYEKWYHEGDGSRFSAGLMQPDDGGGALGMDLDLCILQEWCTESVASCSKVFYCCILYSDLYTI